MSGGHRGGHQSAFLKSRGGSPTRERRYELHRRTTADVRGPDTDELLIRGFCVGSRTVARVPTTGETTHPLPSGSGSSPPRMSGAIKFLPRANAGAGWEPAWTGGKS